jgi:hypothetical protein
MPLTSAALLNYGAVHARYESKYRLCPLLPLKALPQETPTRRVPSTMKTDLGKMGQRVQLMKRVPTRACAIYFLQQIILYSEVSYMHRANYCVYIGQNGTKGSTNEAGVYKGMRKSLPATVREQEHRLKEQHDMSQRLKDRLKGLALRTYATGDLSSSMPSTPPPPPPAPHNTVERIHLPSLLHTLSPAHIAFFPNNQDHLEESHPDTEEILGITPLRPPQAAEAAEFAEAAETQSVLHPYVPYRSSLHSVGGGGSLAARGGGSLSRRRNEAEARLPFFEILQNIAGRERERDLDADHAERIDELFGAFSEVVCARRSLRDSATYQQRQKRPTVMSKETQKRLDSASGLCCLEARRQTSKSQSLPEYQRLALCENLRRLVDQEALLRRHVHSFISHKSSSVCLDPTAGGDGGERAERGGSWGGGEGGRGRKIGASREWVGGLGGVGVVGGVGEEAMESESVGWLQALAPSAHMEATEATSCARATSEATFCARVASSNAHRSRGLMASDERAGWMDGWRMIGRDSTGKKQGEKNTKKFKKIWVEDGW